MADDEIKEANGAASPTPTAGDIQPPPATPVKTPSKGKAKAKPSKSINTNDANGSGRNAAPSPSPGRKSSAKPKFEWKEAPVLDDGQPKPIGWVHAKLNGTSAPPLVTYTEEEIENINFDIYKCPEIWKDDEFEPDCPAYSLVNMTIKPDNLAHQQFWKGIRWLWQKYNVGLWPRMERNAFIYTASKMNITKNTIKTSMNSVFNRLNTGTDQPMACHPMILGLIFEADCFIELDWFKDRWASRYALPEASYSHLLGRSFKNNVDKGATIQWIDGVPISGEFAPKECRKGPKTKKDGSGSAPTQTPPPTTTQKAPTEPAEVVEETSLFVPDGDDNGGALNAIASEMAPPAPRVDITPSRHMEIDENYDDEGNEDVGRTGNAEEQVLKLRFALTPATEADDGSAQVDPDSSVDSEGTGSCIEVETPHSLDDCSLQTLARETNRLMNEEGEGEHEDDVSLFGPDPPREGLPSSQTLTGEERADEMDVDEPEADHDDPVADAVPCPDNTCDAVGDSSDPKDTPKAVGNAPSSPTTPLKRKASDIEPDSTPRARKRGAWVPFDCVARDEKLVKTVDNFVNSYHALIGKAQIELDERRDHIERLERRLKSARDASKELKARVTHLESLHANLERQHAAGLEEMKAQDHVVDRYKLEIEKKDDELEKKSEELEKKEGEFQQKQSELEEEKQKHAATAAKLEAVVHERQSAATAPSDATAEEQPTTIHPDEELMKRVDALESEIKTLKKDNKKKKQRIDALTEMLKDDDGNSSGDGED